MKKEFAYSEIYYNFAVFKANFYLRANISRCEETIFLKKSSPLNRRECLKY